MKHRFFGHELEYEELLELYDISKKKSKDVKKLAYIGLAIINFSK